MTHLLTHNMRSGLKGQNDETLAFDQIHHSCVFQSSYAFNDCSISLQASKLQETLPDQCRSRYQSYQQSQKYCYLHVRDISLVGGPKKVEQFAFLDPGQLYLKIVYFQASRYILELGILRRGLYLVESGIVGHLSVVNSRDS